MVQMSNSVFNAVRSIVFRHYVETGRSATVKDLVARSGWSETTIRNALEIAAISDLFVFDSVKKPGRGRVPKSYSPSLRLMRRHYLRQSERATPCIHDMIRNRVCILCGVPVG